MAAPLAGEPHQPRAGLAMAGGVAQREASAEAARVAAGAITVAAGHATPARSDESVHLRHHRPSSSPISAATSSASAIILSRTAAHG